MFNACFCGNGENYCFELYVPLIIFDVHLGECKDVSALASAFQHENNPHQTNALKIRCRCVSNIEEFHVGVCFCH